MRRERTRPLPEFGWFPRRNARRGQPGTSRIELLPVPKTGARYFPRYNRGTQNCPPDGTLVHLRAVDYNQAGAVLREPDFTSVLEGDQTSHGWIREAVLAGFHVTRKSVLEIGVSGHRYNQVIPAIELLERQLIAKCLPRAQSLRD
jgi:hypothetical protein